MQSAGTAHRVAEQVSALVVDVELLTHHGQYVEHVLLTELAEVGRCWGCVVTRDDGGTVPAANIVALRTHHYITASFRQLHQFAFQHEAGTHAQTVQVDDQRCRRAYRHFR